jgi:hypothetical protein
MKRINFFKVYALIAVLFTAFLTFSCAKEEITVGDEDDKKEQKQEECAEEETAWAAGVRYINPGNWATYTAYDGTEKTVPLFASKDINIGTVKFSAVANDSVTISIAFVADWGLQAGEETVKVQGYETAPSGNPAPGLFKYKDNDLSFKVKSAKFYGIHLDVRKLTPCDEN